MAFTSPMFVPGQLHPLASVTSAWSLEDKRLGGEFGAVVSNIGLREGNGRALVFVFSMP